MNPPFLGPKTRKAPETGNALGVSVGTGAPPVYQPAGGYACATSRGVAPMPRSGASSMPVHHAPIPAVPASRARTIQRLPDYSKLPGNVLGQIGSLLGGQDRVNFRATNTHVNRMVMNVPNLTGTATMTQEHHGDYTYGGVLDKLDPFLTGKLLGPDKAPVPKERIDIEFRNRVAIAIRGWNCQSSIMNHLLVLISSQQPAVSTQQWVQNANQTWRRVQPLEAHILEVFLARRDAIAKRLVSAKHTMDLRIRDMHHLPNPVKIVYWQGAGKKAKKVGEGTSQRIVWQDVLTSCRRAVRAALTGAQPAPPPHNWKDLSLNEHLLTDAVLKDLITKKVLDADGTVNTRATGEWKPGVKCTLELKWGNATITQSLSGKSIDNDWNFALGHLRFMMFTEWKVCYGLLTGQL